MIYCRVTRSCFLCCRQRGATILRVHPSTQRRAAVTVVGRRAESPGEKQRRSRKSLLSLCVCVCEYSPFTSFLSFPLLSSPSSLPLSPSLSLSLPLFPLSPSLPSLSLPLFPLSLSLSSLSLSQLSPDQVTQSISPSLSSSHLDDTPEASSPRDDFGSLANTGEWRGRGRGRGRGTMKVAGTLCFQLHLYFLLLHVLDLFMCQQCSTSFVTWLKSWRN